MYDPNIAMVFILTCMLALLSFLGICLRIEINSLKKIAKKYQDYYEKTQLELAKAKVDLMSDMIKAEALLSAIDNIDKIKMEEIKNELSSGEKNLDK